MAGVHHQRYLLEERQEISLVRRRNSLELLLIVIKGVDDRGEFVLCIKLSAESEETFCSSLLPLQGILQDTLDQRAGRDENAPDGGYVLPVAPVQDRDLLLG
jgi:hypothetical protein